jgi:hypothetical protein
VSLLGREAEHVPRHLNPRECKTPSRKISDASYFCVLELYEFVVDMSVRAT